jgi:peptide/nickel transport system substrate-binding protein
MFFPKKKRRKETLMNISRNILVILIIFMLAVSACQQATPAPPEPAPVQEPAQPAEPVQPPAEEPIQPPAEEPAQPPAEETIEPPPPAEPEQPRETLRFGLRTADLSTLDPHFATSTADRTVVDMIFNGLIRYKPGDSSVFEPDLAVALPEYEMEGDDQVWKFDLRQGVMCHPTATTPAYELTSEDVIYSLEKAADPETSAYSAAYAGMTFEADGPYGLTITLDTPLSSALFFPSIANYGGGFIVCKGHAESVSLDDLKTSPAGTGPFMFQSYTPQVGIELVANDDYFRGRPMLAGVSLRYIAELTSLELALRGGELDAINGGPDQAWINKMNEVPGIKVDVFGVGEVAVLYFNPTIPPLDNPDVRRAISHALDRDEFLDVVGGGPYAAKVFSPVPVQFLAGGMTEDEVVALGLDYGTDRDKAKQMLADAGFPNGFSLDLIASEMTGYRILYENLQYQLGLVGINANLQVVDHSSFHSLIRENLNPLVLYIAWRPNADVYFTRFFHSDARVMVGDKPDTNFTSTADQDDLILEARYETDPDRQAELWKQVQINLMEDAYVYAIQYQNQVYARQDFVDYGHEPISVLALYPGITEKTTINR